ncbi:MAG: DUF805 domain-containing protein [Aestuariivirgaceae bacterium]|nr:DUF805 domain-containing protein [Aestuariivirgaceae bacterium]
MEWLFVLLLILPALLPLIIRRPPGGNRFGAAGEPRSFGGAITTCFQNYARFQGRASRSEYWWFMLFSLLLQMGFALVDAAIFGLPEGGTGLFGGLAGLALLLPTIAVTARRLHDVNRSGWWQLISLGVGAFVLLYWMIKAPVDEPSLSAAQPAARPA